jgi:predicted O-methyltransferase YrrM
MIQKAFSHLRGLASLKPLERVRSLERILSFAVDQLPPEQRDLYLEVPPALVRVEEAKLYADRVAMLAALPRGGIVGEIGVLRGYFSEQIARKCQPDELHLFDIDFGPLDFARVETASSGRVNKHLGDSVASLSAFQPATFDWLYIDGDHSFEGAHRDLVASDRVLKPGGFIMCNDYSAWCVNSVAPYGVARAVNTFVNESGYSVVGLALGGRAEPDILLKKPSDHH